MSKRYNPQIRNHNHYQQNNNPQMSRSNKPLTEDELKNLLTFTDNYYKAWSNYTGVYSPYTTNQRLAEINLSSNKINEKGLKEAFKDPINHQDELVGYSEYLKFTNSIAKRTFLYLGNLASFDMTFHCNNIENPEEYNSDEYKRDLAIFKDVVNRFDYKGEFSKIIKRMLEIDTYYSVFRTDTYKYGFQELPYKYCKTTGKNFDWGLIFDFDMAWFLKPGLSIDQYPVAFKKMYDEVFSGENGENYNPANTLRDRNGTWSLWAQTSPLPEEGGFTAFKFNDDMYANVPFLASLFNDAINGDIVRELQNNQYIIASEKLLVGLIPLLKDPKSGQTKDMLAISPEVMGKFLGTLQQGLQQIKVKGVPFSDVKEVTYELPNKSIYDEYQNATSGGAGVTAGFVYTTNARTATEVNANKSIDSSIIENGIYPQFNTWFSSFVNSLTKKYKFSIKFIGTHFNKQERFENALKLADKGMVEFQSLAHVSGDDYFSFEQKLTQSSYSPIWDIMKLLPNVNTMSQGSTSSVGRPTAKEGQEADSTTRHLDRDVEGGSV